MIKKYYILLLVVIVSSCADKPMVDPIFTDSFDRGEMLTFWAEQIIIPAYADYSESLTIFENEASEFYANPNPAGLESLRGAWLDSYLAWQTVSMFEIGKAEELGLRNFTNIYPTEVDLINKNINSGTYNLNLPSNFPAQGFPALDYLLYGIDETDIAIIDALTKVEVEVYILDLISRLSDLTTIVKEDWNQGFKDIFIANNGSSATASTDKMINDFLFYYEKHLRAAKVGIPAGIFSGNIEADLVEGKYSKLYSKQLFKRGFSAVGAFFNGQSFNGIEEGPSLKQYLQEIDIASNTDMDISGTINNQWSQVELALNTVDSSFAMQVLEDNTKMLSLYDELQKAVVSLKVDMLQAMNIQVDFVDADGD